MRQAIPRIALAAAVDFALASTPMRADDPVTSAVRFNREIIRIIQRKCEPCHAPGGLAMSLSDYRDARAWGRAIREELVEHRMPPAIVAPGYGRYESDPSLTAREMATFLTWLDGGMPRGEDSDLPPRGGTPRDDIDNVVEGADLRLPLPAQTVPAGEELVVRRVTIDAGAAAGRAIARVQVRPGNRHVLRGVLVFAASGDRLRQGYPPLLAEESRRQAPAGSRQSSPLSTGRTEADGESAEASAEAEAFAKADATERGTGLWIGAWLPWQHAVVPPQAHAFNLPARATLVVELYYRGASTEPAVDRSAIDVSFAPATAKGHVDEIIVEATLTPQRTGNATRRARGSAKLSRPTRIWAIHPFVDRSVSSMELRAERPDRSVEVLMWIPKARADWPLALVMQDPLLLPAGTTVSLVVERDASAGSAPPPRVTLSVLR